MDAGGGLRHREQAGGEGGARAPGSQAEHLGLGMPGEVVGSCTIDERPPGGDGVLGPAVQAVGALRNAGDLPAQLGPLVELREEVAGVGEDRHLVGGDQPPPRLRVLRHLQHGLAVCLRGGTERHVEADDLGLEAQQLGPPREEAHDAG